jgi:hypothetical protein
VAGSAPVLVLRAAAGSILAGDEDGLVALEQHHFTPRTRYALPEIA